MNLLEDHSWVICNGYLAIVRGYDSATGNYMLQAFNQSRTRYIQHESGLVNGTLSAANVGDPCIFEDERHPYTIQVVSPKYLRCKNGDNLPIMIDTDGNLITSVSENRVMKTFETGGKRENKDGKGRPDLLPWQAINEVAKHFENGAIAHGDRNWEKGIPLNSYVNSEFRHLKDIMTNNVTEKESLEYHLRANAWNALCLLQTYLWIRDGKLPTSLCNIPITIDLS